MNSRQRLRKIRNKMRDERYIKALLEHHTDNDGCTDMVALNNQLHDETDNPTMEEFFNGIIKNEKD